MEEPRFGVETRASCVVRNLHLPAELDEGIERFDPEVFVLASRNADEPLQHVLDLLSDVPAGKLVIADTGGATTQDELDELERAGIDAVLVRSAE